MRWYGGRAVLEAPVGRPPPSSLTCRYTNGGNLRSALRCEVEMDLHSAVRRSRHHA